MRLIRYQLELINDSAKLGKGTDVHLPHRPAAMDFHRCLRDTDIARDLLAETTLHDLYQNLPLAGAKQPEALLESGQGIFALPPGTIAREAEQNGIKEFLITKRLRKKLNCTTLSSLEPTSEYRRAL